MRKSALAAVGSFTALAVAVTYCHGPTPVEPEHTGDVGNMTDAAALDGIVSCEAPDGAAFAAGALRNVSDETWVFDVTVEWYDVDGVYYTGATTRTQGLRPGAAARWVVDPGSPYMPGGHCEVVDIAKIEPDGTGGGTQPVFPDGS